MGSISWVFVQNEDKAKPPSVSTLLLLPFLATPGLPDTLIISLPLHASPSETDTAQSILREPTLSKTLDAVLRTNRVPYTYDGEHECYRFSNDSPRA